MDDYDWSDWDNQASEYMDYAGYEDPYYSNYEAAPAIEYYGTPQSVGNLTELFGTTPQSTTTTQPSWWDAIPSGEARYAPADPREALQQRMLEAQVALMEKQAGIGQQNQRELAPWQSWIKDNQGALSLGLGALTLLDKLNQQKQDKKQQSFVRDVYQQQAASAAEDRAESKANQVKQNQPYSYETYMRPFLGLSGQDMKKFGRAGSRPEMMFDANPVLVGKAVPRDYMSTNPLAPTLVARYAKGGPAHLTGASNAGRNYEAQQGLDQFMQFLVDRVREMASKRNQPEEQKIEIEVEAGEEAPEPEEKARGGYLKGGTSGQSDKVPAMLSDGEYVIDSDVVSALGDGNNEAGAAKLDAMRKNIRTHKRSAPADKIPPKAKAPEAYMKGKK